MLRQICEFGSKPEAKTEKWKVSAWKMKVMLLDRFGKKRTNAKGQKSDWCFRILINKVSRQNSQAVCWKEQVTASVASWSVWSESKKVIFGKLLSHPDRHYQWASVPWKMLTGWSQKSSTSVQLRNEMLVFSRWSGLPQQKLNYLPKNQKASFGKPGDKRHVIQNSKDLRLDFSNQQDQWIQDFYGILNWTGENYDKEKLRLIEITSSKEQRMKKQTTRSFGRKWNSDSQTIVRYVRTRHT
jgi:hypothetical protein